MIAPSRNALVAPSVKIWPPMTASWSGLGAGPEPPAASSSAATVGDRLRGQGGQHGQPERAAHLLHRVEHARADAGVLVPQVVHRGQGQRHEHQAHTDRHQQDAGQHVSGVAALDRVDREAGVVRQPREQEQAGGGQQRADAREVARVEAVDQVGGQTGREHEPEAERQERDARFERAVAHDVLDVLAEVEEHREHRGRREEHRAEAGCASAVEEHPRRQQRVLDPALDEQEQGQHDSTTDEAGHGQRVAPALAAGPAEPVDQAEQAEGAGDGARDVELAAVRLRLTQEARSQQGGGDADRGVDQQGDPPALDVQPEDAVETGEPATEDQADGSAGTGHGGVHREGAVALGAGRERGGDQGQSGRRRERGTETLQTTSGQQHALVGRETAEQRSDAEDDQADHEDPAASVEVTEPATEQQQASERQCVAGDDPGQVALERCRGRSG